MENEKVDNLKKYNVKDIKPFLSVFITLLIIIIAYYFVWKNIATKVKDTLVESFKDFKYESVTVSGFPFSKIILVKNINFTNGTLLTTENYVSIGQIKVSSLIFGRSLDISLKDIKTINASDNSVFTLNYNEEPKINISFYSDGMLRSFNYSDIGYRVINNNNETLYTADKSLVNIESTKNDNTVDYSIVGDLKNMQNISVLNKKDQISKKEEPEIYAMKFNISSSLTMKDKQINSSIIKIITANLVGNKDTNVSLTGEIIKSPDDPYSYGQISLALSNYQKWLSTYKNEIIEALTIESKSNKDFKKEQLNEYVNMTNKLFIVLEDLIAKNPETKNNNGIIVLERKKNSQDYTLNGDSLFTIIQTIMKQ
ncbi:MAG TPA: hypothetical protein VLL98_04670 [Rickettsiales bacterium]|nr:hypothetical protein [Rickettsiales bacterium]